MGLFIPATGLPSRRRFLGAVAVGCAGVGSGWLAACSSAPDTPATTTPITPPNAPTTTPSASLPARSGPRLDVRHFGAVGDGRTDDTVALERALQELTPGATLEFPAGAVFPHGRVLTVRTPQVTLVGPGRLLATDEEASSLQVDADDVVVDGLSLGVASTTQRWSAPAQHKLYLGRHRGIVVRDVTIDGSAAAGLFCAGATQFRLEHVHVSDTRADGIHLTQGSSDGMVVAPVTTNTGDDGVAVVSYLEDGQACHDITVQSPTVDGTAGGRGISVVGGERVQYRDVNVSATNAAAVYVACEGGDFVTFPATDVSFTGGRIHGANTNDQIDHGAVLVYSGRDRGTVDHVLISSLDITDTRPTASRQVGVVADGAGCGVSDVTFADLRLDAAPTPYQGNAPSAAVRLQHVTSDRLGATAGGTR